MTAPDERVEDDDDIDEDPEDEDEAQDEEHEEGRIWHLISQTSHSITRAMEIHAGSTHGPTVTFGCLVRVETYGSTDGEYSCSIALLPHVRLEDLKHETHPEQDAEPGSSTA